MDFITNGITSSHGSEQVQSCEDRTTAGGGRRRDAAIGEVRTTREPVDPKSISLKRVKSDVPIYISVTRFEFK
ncbi:hypothetical protein F511_43453 [Dorcoceras hygrometricum]|uniref:Uncharacterized protein n=1 Tax=Dorcoceras hygrometricum TaxID=472368 RepID=A0A2Z6ZYV6_9LAMI|nr:hypothetical protein F511_43453 [Dorcoceras hygrometricum]